RPSSRPSPCTPDCSASASNRRRSEGAGVLHNLPTPLVRSRQLLYRDWSACPKQLPQRCGQGFSRNRFPARAEFNGSISALVEGERSQREIAQRTRDLV